MHPLARAVLTACLTVATTAACMPISSEPAPGSSVPPAVANQLDALTVAAARPMSGYSRDRFPQWRMVADGCDARDMVLKRDGRDVKTTKDCKITSGTWVSVYDSKTIKDPQLIDIDHMVPLANAWRSGADGWDDNRRTDFANDLTRPQLVAVSQASNRAKGDQDPSTWKPPNKAFWCEYAQRWITVKAFWRLTVTEREKSALREMLGTCRAVDSTPSSR